MTIRSPRCEPAAVSPTRVTPVARAVLPVLAALGTSAMLVACNATPPAAHFEVAEATIDEVHAVMMAGQVTAEQLVDEYLARIDAYDKVGPALNAIITINPRARERVKVLDEALAASGELSGPLHGIPVIVKDNYDTHDMPTTAGSASLADSVPPDDAHQVRMIREAGAIVIAKSNMAEFAFSPYETVGSALLGYTRNPYAVDRVTAGSSGGTGAAVAASLGTVGLGTDTGNSIRGPSSHNLLVGIRSTMGLTSRDGIVPLYLDHDIGGPMARTVTDAVRVFDVLAGHDPADAVTAESEGTKPDGSPRRAPDYNEHVRDGELDGARIGVVRQLSEVDSGHEEIKQRFNEALDDMREAGATVIDIHIDELDGLRGKPRWCARFRYDLNNYLASLGEAAPYRTLTEIFESGKFHRSARSGIEDSIENDVDNPDESDACQQAWQTGRELAAGIRRVLASDGLDALVYPTWSNPPRLIGDQSSPAGDNSQDLSPHTGFPAITVPMGFVETERYADGNPFGGPGLPAGMTFLGEAWSEPRLIELAYSFEQTTQHRVPPRTTPPLDR